MMIIDSDSLLVWLSSLRPRRDSELGSASATTHVDSEISVCFKLEKPIGVSRCAVSFQSDA
eukprot:1193083-Rhodomonas_salina.2